jgi:uncharacterized protein DUF4153
MDRTTATRTLTAAFVVGIVSQALLVGADFGINVPLLLLATLVAGLAVAAGGRRIDRLDLWLPVAALVVAAMLAIRADPTLRFLNLVAAASLLGASMAAFAGAAVTRRSAIAIVATGIVVLGWIVAGILRATVAARRSATGPGWRERMPAWVAPVARGLFLAIPILAVFVALFSSADAIFATLTADLFGWQIDLGELPARLSVGFLVAWVVAGLLGVAAGAAELEWPQNPPQMQSLGAAVVEPLPLTPRLGVTEALTILVAVDVLFAVFVSLQVAYLFGGLDTLAAGGITYANYARRGFFELVMVTCLAGGLVVGLNAVVIHRTRAFAGAAVGLALLTFVILASAALRLRIYQEAYGWTELRFYIYATIAWLGVGIVAAVVLLARNRMRWLVHAMTIAAVGVLIGVNVIGPQRHVAEQNVARLLDPSLVPADGRTGLDIYYARTLEGVDAVPALVVALPALGAADRASLMIDLEYRWQQLQQPEATAWPAWNLARQRAREALQPLFGP